MLTLNKKEKALSTPNQELRTTNKRLRFLIFRQLALVKMPQHRPYDQSKTLLTNASRNKLVKEVKTRISQNRKFFVGYQMQ